MFVKKGHKCKKSQKKVVKGRGKKARHMCVLKKKK